MTNYTFHPFAAFGLKMKFVKIKIGFHRAYQTVNHAYGIPPRRIRLLQVEISIKFLLKFNLNCFNDRIHLKQSSKLIKIAISLPQHCCCCCYAEVKVIAKR